MVEECNVVKVKNNLAYIKIVKSAKCEGCRSCAFGDSQSLIMPAIMDVQCGEGDRVIVEMPSKQLNSAALILFGIPLLMFLIGITVGRLIVREISLNGNRDLYMVLFGFIFMAIGFLIAFVYDRSVRTKREYMPVVKEKLLRIEENLTEN